MITPLHAACCGVKCPVKNIVLWDRST